MEQQIRIEWTAKGGILTVEGTLTKEVLSEIMYVDHHDKRSAEAKYLIVDFTRTTAGSISHRDVDCVAAIDVGASRTNPGMKLALVATAECTLSWGNYYLEISRKLGVTWDMRIFDDLAEAKSWCGA